MDEDSAWIYERMTMTKPLTSTACAPKVPDRYDALDDLYKEEETLWKADAYLEYYWIENFDGKGRLKKKS